MEQQTESTIEAILPDEVLMDRITVTFVLLQSPRKFTLVLLHKLIMVVNNCKTKQP